MPDRRRLVLIDPGHFHAALVQKEMLAGVSPRAHVYAPLGPDLLDYLAHIARFNARAVAPTGWALGVEAGDDFLDRLRAERPGGIAVLSGRNRAKIRHIEAALAAGLHVLADKPAMIRRDDLPRLAAALNFAAAHRLVLADMMTGRQDVVSRAIRLLRDDPEIFGEPVAGTAAEPAAALTSVHHLLKRVAGVANRRPPWYFDIGEQGEGLADTGVHLVDRAHRTLLPGVALDPDRDIEILGASRWPTRIGLAQFREVTGEDAWPAALAPWLRDDRLDYFCNGRADYRVRGLHVRLEVRWEWQAAQGGDSHSAVFRGSRCHIELRQGIAENYRPELYLVPQADIAAALAHRIAAAAAAFPGLAAERRDGEWRILIPDALRLGHEAQFAQFARAFLALCDDPAALPAEHAANLLAKYAVTTGAVAASHG